ncbi:DUF3817 domain-containing protein [Amycolatopsis suaedae]|uniref:DUF3817 domain-containing protein n=1 Tax=Amycolatopsis suaedae TaxID=2510978 RepID=A0A4Q7J5N0_9PSEU|nr:DUF3817 domain-containing protein [Amycolatopsis suaedae]RZQ62419.1 DUF3817 domain-containing protein [Amycolatopsis suaedae]
MSTQTPSPRVWQALKAVSVAELATLVVLLANVATVHLPVVSSLFGPLHGSAYLATIALTWVAGCPGRGKAMALIPGIGGLLVVRTAAPLTSGK